MEEIFNNLLEKPLAFLITIFGILFLGLSGLTKLFQIEIDKKNSSRLFIAGMALIIAGIPIYYFVENKDSTKLSVELINISYYENDSGHNCSGSSNIHIRETFKINNTKDEKLFKIILNSKTPIAREILYKDSNSNMLLIIVFHLILKRIFLY